MQTAGSQIVYKRCVEFVRQGYAARTQNNFNVALEKPIFKIRKMHRHRMRFVVVELHHLLVQTL
jgi:hypothetical protein